MNSYRDPVAWKAAMELAAACYAATKMFPNSEIYGMSSQIRRSAASVAADIAEGHGRENSGAFIQFLRVSKESETHLVVSARVGLLPDVATARLLGAADEIGRMLRSLVRSLQQKP